MMTCCLLLNKNDKLRVYIGVIHMQQEEYKNMLTEIDPDQEIKKYQKYFSVRKFTAKLLKYAKKMGVKLSYYSILLFFSYQSPNTSKKDKLVIAGALGYLIFPIDLIPDFIPVIGFADDLSIIVYAVSRVISNIDHDMKIRANKKMKQLFGENDDKNMDVNVRSNQ